MSDVYAAAQAQYNEALGALKNADASVFPGDQLQYAVEFHNAVQVQYPKPYSRYVPLLAAYWIYQDGAYWYVVHDMITLLQIVRRYITHTGMQDFSPEVLQAYSDLWDYQPEAFKSQWPGTQSATGDWWHMPEGYPVKMPPEAVQYAMDQGLELQAAPVLGHVYMPPPVPDFKSVPVQTNQKTKARTGMLWIGAALVIALGGVIYYNRKDAAEEVAANPTIKGRYLLDGHPVDLGEFLEDNSEVLHPDEAREILDLAPGETFEGGGGAWARYVIQRVR